VVSSVLAQTSWAVPPSSINSTFLTDPGSRPSRTFTPIAFVGVAYSSRSHSGAVLVVLDGPHDCPSATQAPALGAPVAWAADQTVPVSWLDAVAVAAHWIVGSPAGPAGSVIDRSRLSPSYCDVVHWVTQPLRTPLPVWFPFPS
jgi:hypothetical protein